MEFEHINDIYVEKYFSILQLRKMKISSWSTVSVPINCNIIGFGYSGHLVASFYAYIQQRDVSFIRYSAKTYGTCKQIDGNYLTSKSSVLFCRREDISEITKLIKHLHINVLNIFTFDEKSMENVFVPHSDFETIKLDNQLTESKVLENYVKLLQGSTFTLSSGKKAEQYYETLPAANSYEPITNVCRILKNKEVYSATEISIGIAFGGTYLAVASALTRGMNPTIFIPGDINNLLKAKCLFLDDFVSTGKNFMNAHALVDRVYANSIRCVSIYSIKDVKVFDKDVEILCKIS